MSKQLNNTLHATQYEVNPIDLQTLKALLAFSGQPSTLKEIIAATGINIGKLAPWVQYLKDEGIIIPYKKVSTQTETLYAVADSLLNSK